MLSSALGIFIILQNLEQSVIFYYPPSEIKEDIAVKRDIRVGGLVKVGSVIKITSREIQFTITDNISELIVSYIGVPPVLFRENQGIIARGKIFNNVLIASELLTKHDENYMPPGP